DTRHGGASGVGGYLALGRRPAGGSSRTRASRGTFSPWANLTRLSITGRRRPCSKFWMVSIDRPLRAASSLCESCFWCRSRCKRAAKSLMGDPWEKPRKILGICLNLPSDRRIVKVGLGDSDQPDGRGRRHLTKGGPAVLRAPRPRGNPCKGGTAMDQAT